MRNANRTAIAGLVIGSLLLAGCGSQWHEPINRPVLVLNQTNDDLVVRVTPMVEGNLMTTGYRIPASGGGFLAEDMEFFDGEIFDAQCAWLSSFSNSEMSRDDAFTRVVFDPRLVIAIERVPSSASVDQSQWGRLRTTQDCTDEEPPPTG